MYFNDLIFVFLLIIYFYYQNKFLIYITNKRRLINLSDDNFTKPQAFHEKSTHRLGGIIIFLSLSLVFAYLLFFKNIFIFEIVSFCTLFFILGLIDDLKIEVKPKFRLFLMIAFLLALLIHSEFKIERISLDYLNHLMKIDIFALFFITLCFLFIINGANLIDGFNGLLGIHSLIILSILFYINLINENYNLAYALFFICLIILFFIKFNFPKAQIFLGDSGAYTVGTLVAVTTIMTNNLNPSISSFFFCILLFYLFFEVFFSFFRKTFFVRQNPLLPDSKHLHMLVYKFLLKKNNEKLKSNYMVTVYINSLYILLNIPGLFFMTNGLFCRIYFLFLLFFYIYFYKVLYHKQKL